MDAHETAGINPPQNCKHSRLLRIYLFRPRAFTSGTAPTGPSSTLMHVSMASRIVAAASGSCMVAACAQGHWLQLTVHRIASQPLLSGVDE